MKHVIWAYIDKYLGWRSWSVLHYNAIFENSFVIFFITLAKSSWTNTQLLYIICYFLFSMSATSYGYLINDFADRSLDKLHKKPNTFSDDSFTQSFIIILLFFVLTLSLSIPFADKPWFLPLFFVWLFLATFYSLKPLRFKEQGLFGLIVIVITQRVLPITLLLLAFEYYSFVDWVVVIGLLLMRGAASDIWHQIDDYDNDIKTGTGTLAVEFGISKLFGLLQVALLFERFFMLLFLILCTIRLQLPEVWGIPLSFIPLGVYVSALSVLLFKAYPAEKRNPFMADKNIYQVIHLVFPNIVLPLFLLIFIVRENLYYIVFLVAFVFIYRLYKMDTLRNSFFYRFLAGKSA